MTLSCDLLVEKVSICIPHPLSIRSASTHPTIFAGLVSQTTEEHCTVEYREKRLFYALNSGGLYHSFLERLKPRVQRIVRKRFGTVPTDPEESNAFIAELYVHLVEQAAIVLNQRIR